MRSRLLVLVTGAIMAVVGSIVPVIARGSNGGAMAGATPAGVVAPVRAAAVPTAKSQPAGSRSPGVVDERALLVDSAVRTLSSHVSRLSDPSALRVALKAYYNFKAVHPEQVRKRYLYFVDYGLDSRVPRGYVFDMAHLTVVEGPFTVAHGRGSSRRQYGVPTHFSNASGSKASSLGLYVTGSEYAFTGRTGGRPYHSVGLRLRGVSGRFNNQAGPRRVVVHGAPYVTPQHAGRSEGCPAMELTRARRLLPLLARGGMVFLFSPRDANWLHHDPWVNLPTGTLASGTVSR